MVEYLEETRHLLHSVVGLLNFLGGEFSEKDLDKMSFAHVSDCLIRNGGTISVGTNDSVKREFNKD